MRRMGCKMNSRVAGPINRQVGTGKRFGRRNAGRRLIRDKLRKCGLRLRGTEQRRYGYS